MILTPDETLPIVRRHTSSFLVFFLLEKKLLPTLNFAEIGAFNIRAGDGFPHPSPLYWIPGATMYACEAHPDSFRKLQTGLNRYPARVLAHQVALAEEVAQRELYETVNPLYSSLCGPLKEPTHSFFGLEGLKRHRSIPVVTQPLDALRTEVNIPELSAITLDANGFELPILKGARTSLHSCLMVSVRIGLYPLYENQSSLGATAEFLRECHLQFHHTRHPHQHRLEGTQLYHTPQVLNTEAVFFPSLERLPQLSLDQLLGLAIISSLYEVLDLAEKALHEYDRRQGTKLLVDFRLAFLDRFNPPAGKALAKQTSVPYGVPETTFMALNDGVEVAVPDTLQLLTPYVLREQGDWFEIELPWLRRILKSGMKVLDIGANYGIYSLSLSKVVGPTGQVWAVEPTPGFHAHLVKSRDKNLFHHLQIFQQALSLTQGEAAFYISGQAELNSLTPSGTDTECIRVATDTLDHFAETHGIREVDLLKIDAEGEEVNIFEGGRQFLADNDPLILAEIRHGRRFHLEMVRKMDSLGYRSYRLIPGLGILTAFDAHGEPDQSIMNVLACKPSRAEILHRAGLLSPSHETYDEVQFPESAFELYLSCLPYGPVFASRNPADWMQRFEGGEIYRDCLHAFSVSLLSSVDPNKRVGLLEFAFHKLHDLVEKEATLPRLLSLARIASAWGHSEIARNILSRLTLEILAGQEFRMMEPFLCPSADFDLVDPKPNPILWCVATILHEKVKLASFSSFFETSPPLAELQKLESIGYLLPTMRRRLEVIRQRQNVS